MPLKFDPYGVMPATLLAFNEDFSIDERSTRAHMADVASVRGVKAIVVNGHASEVSACSPEEQKQLIEMAVDEIGERTPIVSGICADGSAQAARLAKMAQAAGASALLVFPSQAFWMGATQRPETVLTHFRAVADSSDLPLIIFQYAASSPVAYSAELIEQLVEKVPSIVGLKDTSYDPQTHELLTRTLQGGSRPVTMFTSQSGWLLGSLVMGAKGLLSGSGSIIAELQVALFEAVQRGDLAAAQAINDRIYITVRCFYRQPAVDMHNRMKEGLVMLGKLDRAVVRPPLIKLSDGEIAGIRKALVGAGLLKPGAGAAKH